MLIYILLICIGSKVVGDLHSWGRDHKLGPMAIAGLALASKKRQSHRLTTQIGKGGLIALALILAPVAVSNL